MAPTVRRHPRSLAEAFPRTAEYACAIVRYSNPTHEAVGVIAAVIGIAVLVAIVMGVL